MQLPITGPTNGDNSLLSEEVRGIVLSRLFVFTKFGAITTFAFSAFTTPMCATGRYKNRQKEDCQN
jgi:hypothetical protein